MTNLEKIRAMTAEELAEFLDRVTIICSDCSDGRCRNCPLNASFECSKEGISKWLESEVSENDTE